MKNYCMKKSFPVDFDILCHILRYCERIENIIERFGNEEEIFQNDMAYRDAVSMNLLQIGELAGHLSEDYRLQTRKDMNWSAIKGMRNLFAHDYGNMDEHIIWNTAVESIQELKGFCLLEISKAESLFQEEQEMEGEEGLEL